MKFIKKYKKKQANNNHYIVTLLHCLIITLFSSCAVVSSPTGGERDKNPPKTKNTIPANNTINFASKKIEIFFDEFVQIQNPNQTILISPTIDPNPVFTIKKDKIEIDFKNKLQENTTYLIQFGNNIKDVNEGNALENFSYIFSTGNFIDSLEIKGKIKLLELEKIPENTFVLLYKNLDDSAFLTQKPYYIYKLQNDGSFNFKNLAAGNYKIYALADKNLNYYYDLPTEEIGFLDSTIFINTTNNEIEIPLFKTEEQKFRILDFDKTISNQKLNITLNKPISDIDEIVAKTINSDIIAFTNQTNKNQLQLYFINNIDTLSKNIAVFANNSLVDSILVKYNTKPKLQYFLDTTSNFSLKWIVDNPLKIESKYFIKKIDTTKIAIKDTNNINIPFQLQVNENLKNIQILAKIIENSQNFVFINDSAFQDISGIFNTKQTIKTNTISAKKTGNLLIINNIKSNTKTHLLTLKDANNKIIEQKTINETLENSIEFNFLTAGEYTLEYIEDKNNDGIWNSGNFYTKTLPERKFVSKKIIVKENWDTEEKIEVDYNLAKIPVVENTSPTPNLKPNQNKNTEDKKNNKMF